MRNRYLAGILGALVGDALGVPFESKSAETIPAAGEIEMVMPPGFIKSHGGIPYGTWSDDGSQLLCLLEALQQSFDPAFFGALLVRWLREGRHQSGGIVFDCGGQTARAIRALENGASPAVAGSVEERSNGNGSLMRTLPVAIKGHLQRWAEPEIAEVAHRASRVTHGHPVSEACCALYCLIANRLLEEPSGPIDDCTRSAFSSLSEIYRRGESGSHARALAVIDAFPKSNFSRGSGYVVDTFWTAIDCLKRSNSYVGAVRYAIGYGNDTDTTACVTGGLAGIRYGAEIHSGIPGDWISRLLMPKESRLLLSAFLEMPASGRPVGPTERG